VAYLQINSGSSITPGEIKLLFVQRNDAGEIVDQFDIGYIPVFCKYSKTIMEPAGFHDISSKAKGETIQAVFRVKPSSNGLLYVSEETKVQFYIVKK